MIRLQRNKNALDEFDGDPKDALLKLNNTAI